MKKKFLNLHGDIPANPKGVEGLMEFLAWPREITEDLIVWWDAQQEQYGNNLANMAIDFMLIPNKSNIYSIPATHSANMLSLATSVDVEHVFSYAQLLIPHVQNCLSAQTIWALMCIGEWSCENLLSMEDLKAIAWLPEFTDWYVNYLLEPSSMLYNPKPTLSHPTN